MNTCCDYCLSWFLLYVVSCFPGESGLAVSFIHSFW